LPDLGRAQDSPFSRKGKEGEKCLRLLLATEGTTLDSLLMDYMAQDLAEEKEGGGKKMEVGSITWLSRKNEGPHGHIPYVRLKESGRKKTSPWRRRGEKKKGKTLDRRWGKKERPVSPGLLITLRTWYRKKKGRRNSLFSEKQGGEIS